MTVARKIVESEYDIFFPRDVGHNSLDAQKYTADQVDFYLKNGTFLRDEKKDAEVNVSSSY